MRYAVRPFLRRPRLASLAAALVYLVFALGFTPLAGPTRVEAAGPCPTAFLHPGAEGLTVLQGNLWMLPYRPLLLTRSFATDRTERLERLVGLIGACRPDVVALQEVFERSVVASLETAFPDYTVHTSGLTDALGSVNTSGLVTMTRVPARRVRFHEFEPLPRDARLIERLGRKGFLAVEVGVPGVHVTVVNTHLFSAQHLAEEALAFAQLAEIEAFVGGERARGRGVAVTGDFNLEAHQIAPRLGAGWHISHAGPTYDPGANPYTVQGANDTEAHRRRRATASGVRAIDLLALGADDVGLRSVVLSRPLLSDHQFVAHRLTGPGTP